MLCFAPIYTNWTQCPFLSQSVKNSQEQQFPIYPWPMMPIYSKLVFYVCVKLHMFVNLIVNFFYYFMHLIRFFRV